MHPNRRLSPRGRLVLAALISSSWLAVLVTGVALTVANWR